MTINRIHLKKTLLALKTVSVFKDDPAQSEGPLNEAVGVEFKGWSLSSCFQWLSGKRCKHVLEVIGPDVLTEHGLCSESVSKTISLAIDECLRRNLGSGCHDISL